MNPEDVLKEFIIAMNAWETSTWQSCYGSKDNRDNFSLENLYQAQEPLQEIYRKFCTRSEPRHSRGISNPFDYDPDNEDIIEIIYPTTRRAIIKTSKPTPAMPLIPTVTEYVLLKKGGEWRVDNKKYVSVYDSVTKYRSHL